MSLVSTNGGPYDADITARFGAVKGRLPTATELEVARPLYASRSIGDFDSWIAALPAYSAAESASMGLALAGQSGNLNLGALGTAVGTVVGGPVGGILGGALGGALGGGGGGGRPPSVPSAAAGGFMGGLGGALGGLIPSMIPGLTGGGTPARNGGKAPTATFFGGECPPGRVLRRVNNGRDICIKRPQMNPFNPRALARADRRVTAFARRSKSILQDLGFKVSPRKKTNLGGKKRRRR